MSRSRIFLVLLLIVSMGITSLMFANREVDAAEPIYLEGRYLTLTYNETYSDSLQPGDSASYSVVMENRNFFDIVYRITVDRIPDGWYSFFTNGQRTVLVNVPSKSEKRESLNVKATTPGIGNIRINVSREDMPSWHVMTLEIKCQDGPLTISLQTNTFSLGRQDPVTIGIDISNIGIEPVAANISLDGIIHSDDPIENLWTVSYSTRRISLGPGQSETINATVRCPANEPINSQRLTRFLLRADNITRPFESQSITLKVETIFDLRTSVRPLGYQMVNMGSSISFNISVENWATATDHVIFVKDTIPGGWTVIFDDVIDPFEVRFSILPGGKRTLVPYIYVPLNTQAGRKEIVIIAEGTKNTSRIVLGVEVMREDSFEIRSTAPDQIYPLTLGQNRIWFRVFNRGNYYDTVELTLISAPSWMNADFDKVRVGSGHNVGSVQGKLTNISSRYDDLFEFPATKEISVAYGPFQSADISIAVDVPLTARPSADNLIGIRYRYGKDGTIGELFLPTKLLMVDLKIVDADGNGLPDLDIWPHSTENTYEVGDTIHVIFSIRNDYPYPPEDIGYVIDIFGVTIAQGDVGRIEPGETKEFNVTWKMDRPTKTSHPLILRLKGSPYTQQSDTPSARTVNEIKINGGRTRGDLMIVLGFVLIMLVILGVFLFAIFEAKKQKAEREEKERRKYEKVYGKRTNARIRTGKMSGDEVTDAVKDRKKRLERSRKPPSRYPERGIKERKRKKNRIEPEGRRKPKNCRMQEDRSSDTPRNRRVRTSWDEIEELEEFEEL
ncbi:MAG: hypothetical protein QCI82_10495 [Candidatus Thermoplasmatota archaeon]|nr:hypothetical protein [Candidatus Thermoplasmatota archaeon]